MVSILSMFSSHDDRAFFTLVKYKKTAFSVAVLEKELCSASAQSYHFFSLLFVDFVRVFSQVFQQIELPLQPSSPSYSRSYQGQRNHTNKFQQHILFNLILVEVLLSFISLILESCLDPLTHFKLFTGLLV